MTAMLKLESRNYERQSECPTHGAYTERGGSFFGGIERAMWFGCAECNTLSRKQEAAEESRKQQQERQARIEARLRAAGIPAAFRDRTFDNYQVESAEMASAVAVAREFADGFWEWHHQRGTFLVFAGERGTGKSHLAIATTAAVMARGTAMYIRASDLIRRVRATWSRHSEQSECDVLRLFGYELDLLIIDEIGVQRGTDDEQIILFDILDRRYAELRPTILLTNLGGQVFEQFIGPRIMDRLRERAVFVPFKWASWRGRQAYS